jgi:pimeloyl-ACP methyl ester carboxylesterase
MVFVYQGVNIDYRFFGKAGERVTLLLHGWGCDGDVFENIVAQFPNRNFLTLDFPPFRNSGKVDENWNIYTYANMVISLCEHMKISGCDVLAHSFGGRVAILISALRPELVGSLILVGSAGLKPKFNLKRYLKIKQYKIKKKFGCKVENMGSSDYQKLDEQTRKVFVSIVNENLKDFCPKIKAKTLVVCGENDKETPLYMAKKLSRLIKNSSLVVLKNAGHFAFLESPLVFCREIDKFWEECK